MRLFFHDDQLLHRPTQYMVHGKIVAPLEKPERPVVMRDRLAGLGLSASLPEDAGDAAILAVHKPHYVSFLTTAFDEFSALPNAGPEVFPNVHPYASGAIGLTARPEPRTKGILGRTGWYIGDLSCAMMEKSWQAAYWSAQTAISGAQALIDGEVAAYALCRPPGHHAYADRASGFCFLNNAAIAAELLRSRFCKVAVLDFDTHHGDGTQAIFYERADVLFASTHTDPANYYPHYFGYAEESGHGDGAGYNLNLPLAPGASDDVFVAAVEQLAERVSQFGADALVISAGWDAHRQDPLSKLDVSTDAYGRLGIVLGRLDLPTLIVQEGGYSLVAVAEAAPTFVSAFRDAHPRL